MLVCDVCMWFLENDEGAVSSDAVPDCRLTLMLACNVCMGCLGNNEGAVSSDVVPDCR